MNVGEPRRTLTVEPVEPVPGIIPASLPPGQPAPATSLEAAADR